MLIITSSLNCKRSSKLEEVNRVSKRSFFVSYKKYKQLLREKEEAVEMIQEYKQLLEEMTKHKENLVNKYERLIGERYVELVKKYKFIRDEDIKRQELSIIEYMLSIRRKNRAKSDKIQCDIERIERKLIK